MGPLWGRYGALGVWGRSAPAPLSLTAPAATREAVKSSILKSPLRMEKGRHAHRLSLSVRGCKSYGQGLY